MRSVNWIRMFLIFRCVAHSCLFAEPEFRGSPQAIPMGPGPTMNLGEILEQVAKHRKARDIRLTIYASDRTYVVENKRFDKRAALSVAMIFLPPEEKLFEVRSYSGSGFLRRSVLNRLIETEREAAHKELREQVAVTPENYRFEFLRLETVNGRPQFVLRAKPRRKHQLLFDGRIWIDREDFAVTRVEGKPAKSPSFWTRKIEFVHEYGKFGDFWLPVRNASVTSAFVFGRTTTEIVYRSYRINDASLFERAATLRKRGRKLEIQIDPADRTKD